MTTDDKADVENQDVEDSMSARRTLGGARPSIVQP